MSATYNLFRNPVAKGEEDKTGTLHARLVNQNTIRINALCEEISNICSFSSSDVKGMLEALRSRIVFHLKYGEIVELEGLGTFNVSMECPPLTDEKEIKPRMVRFSKVVFRSSKGLKSELIPMTVKRADEGSRLKGLPEKTRKANILAYLTQTNTISSSECRAINNCSKYIALKDLKALMEEQKIVKLGRQSNAQYGLIL